MRRRLEKTTNDIRRLLSSKKTFNYGEFLGLVHSAGYRTTTNKNGYLEFYKDKGNGMLVNEDGAAITMLKQDSLRKYKRILRFILEEIEEYK